MHRLLFAVALIAATGSAGAEVPKDILGYSLGQTLDEARAVDPARSFERCEVKGSAGCLGFKADYLKHKANISLVLSADNRITRILFSIFTFDQEHPYECASTAAVVVGAAHDLYGEFSESADPKVKLLYYTWSGNGLEYKLTVMCFPAANGVLVGGVLGNFGAEESAPAKP